MGKFGCLGVLPLLAGAALLLASGENRLAGADLATVPSSAPSAVRQREVRAAAAKMPLRFEENIGQVKGPDAGDVKFVSRGSAYSLFLTPKETVLVMRKHAADAKKSPTVLRMSLSGANMVPAIAGQDELAGRSNYLIGKDASKWHTGVVNYSRVAEKSVYPGIDLVYHGNQGQLEYDFDVAPHADPKKIRIAMEGATGLNVDSNGDLLVKVADGEIRFRQPVAYQSIEGRNVQIPVHYALRGKNQATFALASYDRTQPLVIDPILAYSTYLGGTNIDGGNGIAVAPDNTAFIVGGTFSTDFPTAHPLQPNHSGPDDFYQDAFVTKISADGSTLLYSTYFGGSNQDVGNGIAVDAAGEAFVAGTTISPDFPTTLGAFSGLCGADGQCGKTWNTSGFVVANGFVSKLNTAGSGLVYSSYLGNYENVEAFAIAVDGALNAYVTGAVGPNIPITAPLQTNELPPPPFFITLSTAFEKTYNNQPTYVPPNPLDFNLYPGVCVPTTSTCSGTEAFLYKIDAAGSGVLYASYLGGDNTSYGYGIAVDNAANAYVTGLTYSSSATFPITTGNALQVNSTGAGDAFLTKVSTTATGSPLYSSFLGGTGIDQANAIAVDASGIAYITGAITSRTASLGFTPPAGGYQTDCTLDTLNVCEGDAFVAKINPALTGNASLLYFSYFGGALADSGTGIAVDTTGDVYFTGSTVSANFPIFARVFQSNYGGGNSDAFVAELNTAVAGTGGLIYSTYLGGSNTDTAAGIGIDITGAAYVTGQSCSLDFPLANPEQPTAGGNCDAFVSKIIQSGGVSLSPNGLTFTGEIVGQQSPPQTVTLTNDANVALAVASIAISGINASDFAIQTNTCGSSVPANSTCTITVTFTPTSVTPTTRTAKITFTDTETGGSQETQVLNLTGTAGSAPIVTLSSNSLTFATQAVGTTSAPQTLTISNTGTAALTISAAAASGNFAVASNTCTTPLQATVPASTCTISVTFAPNMAGQSVGSLTITDNAANSPQIILLTGTGTGNGPDFNVAVSGGNTTVVAGDTATVTVTVSSIAGFDSPVTISCAGLPALATCSASSASVTPPASGATTLTLNVNTTRRSLVPPVRLPQIPGSGLTGRPWVWMLAALMLLSLGLQAANKRRTQWNWALLVVTALWLASFAACGSGGKPGYVNPTGTPAGTYIVTVTGTSAGLTHSTTFALKVQ